MENEHQDYINIKLKSFLNLYFSERMDCRKIKNETFIFSQPCKLSISTMEQHLRLIT